MTSRKEKEEKKLSLKEILLKNKPLSFEKIDELYEWIMENTIEMEKKEIAENPSEAFKEGLIVITDGNKPEGLFINFEIAKKLPPEIQAFLFVVINATGCKYLNDK